MSDKVTLTNAQRDDLIEQCVEIPLDNMDTQSLVEWVTDELIFQYGKLSKEELKERVDCYNEGLFEEVVEYLEGEMTTTEDDNGNEVLEDISKYEAYQIYQKLVSLKNEPKVIITDDDYASKVDTLVDNMVASDDNVFTHDSEGC